MQCHEVQEAGQVRETLGIEFNGELKCFRPSGKRHWKIRLALEAFLEAPKVTGKALEVLLGHCTYLAMLQRPLLSCFASVYKFVRRYRHSWAPLWPTAREELESFLYLMPLIRSDRSRGWLEEVLTHDSCPEGAGACVATRSSARAAAQGRVQERARFVRRDAAQARGHALSCLDPDDPLVFVTPPPSFEDVSERWEQDLSFPEVPLEGLVGKDWEVLFCHLWKRKMTVHEGEARAGVPGVANVVLEPGVHSCRLLVLGDNLGVTLSFARSRAGAFPLLVQVRRATALALSRNIFLGFRWIPSEFNSSDEPSRDPGLQRGVRVELSATPEILRLARDRQGSVALLAKDEVPQCSVSVLDWANLCDEGEDSSSGGGEGSLWSSSGGGGRPAAATKEVAGYAETATRSPPLARAAGGGGGEGQPSGIFGRHDFGGGWQPARA